MSLTVQKYPPLFSLVKNRILFKIRSDSIYSQSGVYAKLIWKITTAVADETITLTWGSTSVVLTAKASPDNSGTQFRAKGATALNIWLGLVVIDLRKNYYLSRDFNITVKNNQNWLNPRIYFTAREYGADYDITVSDNTITDYDDYAIQGVAQVINENYGVILQVHRFDGTNYKFVSEDLLTSFDENGDFVDDIHELLSNPDTLFSSFEYPEVNQAIERDEMVNSYVIRYTDKYGTTVNGFLSSSLYYVLNGGIPKWMEKDYWLSNESFWSRIQSEKYFLRTWPNIKYTLAKLPEKLYFLNWKTHALLSNKIEIIAKVYFTDGTNITSTVGVFAGTFYKVFELQVGADRLQLSLLEPYKTIRKYDIWLQLEATSEVISEVVTYIMDNKAYSYLRKFIYKNSLGGFNCFYTTGKCTYQVTKENTLVRQLEPAELTDNYREFIEHNPAYEFTIRCNTGWIPNRETYLSIIDFINSEEKYELLGDNKRPIIILNNSFEAKDGDYLDNFDFEYRYNEYKSIYSPDPAAYQEGDFNDDFSDDFLN